jgi:hypothetical protein
LKALISGLGRNGFLTYSTLAKNTQMIERSAWWFRRLFRNIGSL